MVAREPDRSGRARVVVVDDDATTRDLLRKALENAGHHATTARNGTEAIAAASDPGIDVVLLDLGLPDLDGLRVLRQIRHVRDDLAVLVVSGHSAEQVRLRCFQEGADDYVVKPFYPSEVAARISAVLRRHRPRTPRRLRFGDIEIDRAARTVRVGTVPVQIPAREFDLLVHLATHPGRALTREELLAAVWGSSAEWQDPSTVTEHVRRLRRRIERNPSSPRHIISVRGHGYRFDP